MNYYLAQFPTMNTSNETYKMVVIDTECYKICDMYGTPAIDTGACTPTELVEYIITVWSDGDFGFPGLVTWAKDKIPDLSIPPHGLSDELTPAELEETVATLRTLIATDEERTAFLAAIQGSDSPIFFLKRTEPNPFLVDFTINMTDK